MRMETHIRKSLGMKAHRVTRVSETGEKLEAEVERYPRRRLQCGRWGLKVKRCQAHVVSSQPLMLLWGVGRRETRVMQGEDVRRLLIVELSSSCPAVAAKAASTLRAGGPRQRQCHCYGGRVGGVGPIPRGEVFNVPQDGPRVRPVLKFRAG